MTEKVPSKEQNLQPEDMKEGQRKGSHRLLDVIPSALGSPVHTSVVDDHVLYDVGHLMFQLGEIRISGHSWFGWNEMEMIPYVKLKHVQGSEGSSSIHESWHKTVTKHSWRDTWSCVNVGKTTEWWQRCIVRALQDMSDCLSLFWERAPPWPVVSLKYREQLLNDTHTNTHTHARWRVNSWGNIRGSEPRTGLKELEWTTQHTPHTFHTNKRGRCFYSALFYYWFKPAAKGRTLQTLCA